MNMIFENISVGALMYYGGIAGIVLGVLLILVCLMVFPVKRKRLLKKLGDN